MIDSTFNVPELFKHLFSVMISERFLKMQGLNSDIPFFICPFPTKLKIAVEQMIPQLIKRLKEHDKRVLDINLYDLCIEILKDNELFDQLLEVEPEHDKGFFLESMQSMLDVEEYVIPAIQKKIADFGKVDILFLTGLGE